MAPKHYSRKSIDYDSYSYEDKSDTEYKIEFEDSESDSYSNEMISNSKSQLSKGCDRQPDSNKYNKMKRNRKGAFQWHKVDEIIILKKLYEFSGKNAVCTKSFYGFVKNRLSGEVSMHQLCNKIYRLKKEYLENESRLKDDTLKYSEPHQQKVFELSKRLWETNNTQTEGSSSTAHDVDNEEKLLEYLQSMEIDINCLTPSYLEYLKKEWAVQMLMYIEFLLKKRKFDAKIRELMYRMSRSRNAANK